MKFFKSLSLLTLATCAGMNLASCSNEVDYYDPAKAEEFVKATYAANFVRTFGEVSPNQSWDFSTSGSTYRSTRAEGEIQPVVDSEWYYVEQNTLDFFQKELVEGVNNRAKGAPFIMSAPNNGFAIYPIYQGGAAFKWDLHMVVEQSGVEIADINVWQKHRDMENLLNEETLDYDVNPTKKLSLYDGKNFFDEYGWSRNGETWYTPQQSFTLHDSYTEFLGGADWGGHEPGQKGWWENYEVGFNTMQAKAIRTKGIHFPTLPVGANIYFYLDVNEEKDGEWVKRRQESSLDHMMVALDCETPTNLPNHEITIIGCEDNSDESSDWDMNDLVFMVVGDPIVPKPIEIKEGQYDEIIVSKRYMVEDLGTTDDFDFNDIVVDVEEYQIHTITMTNGVKTADVASEPKQRAIIRALGGTIDFDLIIEDQTIWNKKSDFKLGDVKTMWNTGYDGTEPIWDTKDIVIEDVTGWVPEKNNIKFIVKRNQNVNSGVQDGTGTTITFPKEGDIPMMIATDTNTPWNYERDEIQWWKEGGVFFGVKN
ncbi:MAG: hypothetical protein MJZ73_03465 [Bacteroidaceae bacterium]|nr:hypothetical protein [Bacteroidaceae bacterium]